MLSEPQPLWGRSLHLTQALVVLAVLRISCVFHTKSWSCSVLCLLQKSVRCQPSDKSQLSGSDLQGLLNICFWFEDFLAHA